MIDPDVTKPSPERLFEDPNRYARAPRLDIESQRAIFHGYQEFELTKSGLTVLPEDAALRKKQELLAPYFQPRYLADRTMLDLGANAAFFAFWAIQKGSRMATAVDMDAQYLDMVERAKKQLGFVQLRSVNANIVDWDEPADVVVALALIHWIYSCTASFRSLDVAVARLRGLTKSMLLVEWIDPTDPAITSFGHLEWNKDSAREPYDRQTFEAALVKHFKYYKLIGPVSDTRALYVAFRTEEAMELSCPLPLLFPKETVISSRWLARQHGTEFWSRVYDCGDIIVKQTTSDLAEREAVFLRRLDGEYFPRVESSETHTDYSLVRMEKVNGVPLQETIDQLRASPSEFVTFFKHSLALLQKLKENRICHRDIRLENILIRKGKPVLLDFGWALDTSDQPEHRQEDLVPPGLGEGGRPPDGNFCDVYSMGLVLREIADWDYPNANPIIELMTEPNPCLRIVDPTILRILAQVALDADAPADCETPATGYREAVRALLAHIAWANELERQQAAAELMRIKEKVAKKLAQLIPPRATFVVIDDGFFQHPLLPERHSLPFLEKEGAYYGPPADDETAISELKRMQGQGAQYLVFAWTSFWWFDHYTGFVRYLDVSARRIAADDKVVVFELNS